MKLSNGANEEISRYDLVLLLILEAIIGLVVGIVVWIIVIKIGWLSANSLLKIHVEQTLLACLIAGCILAIPSSVILSIIQRRFRVSLFVSSIGMYAVAIIMGLPFAFLILQFFS